MSDHAEVKGILRGELARRIGCNPETLRYYEKIGLIRPPTRTNGGYRAYGVGDEQRLAFILRARVLGFAIDEIRGLLGMLDRGGYTCAEVQEITLHHLSDVKTKIADLRRLRRTLEHILAECSGEEVSACPVIEALLGGRANPRAPGCPTVEA